MLEEETNECISTRLDPLGADTEDKSEELNFEMCQTDKYANFRLNNNSSPICSYNLEEDQETLITALMALTSHFAQVQFRLRQIVEAPRSDRDELLKNLEEFASQGIPQFSHSIFNVETEEIYNHLDKAKQQQFELIDRLKIQLTELEKYAYDSGVPVLPQSIIMEKQKIIIDELKHKLNFNVNENELPQLSPEDIKNQVDNAIGEFVAPLKMKDQLVAQLKTQITDLERFIAFLQCDSDTNKLNCFKNLNDGKSNAYNTYSAKKKAEKDYQKTKENIEKKRSTNKNIYEKTSDLVEKAATLLQIFTITQFGCGSRRFKKNTLKKTPLANHWGDIRAQLEVDIQEIVSLVSIMQNDKNNYSFPTTSVFIDNDKSSEFDEYKNDYENCVQSYPKLQNNKTNIINLRSTELTFLVRQKFSNTLQNLIQHGLREKIDLSGSIVPFTGCFNTNKLKKNSYDSSTSDEENDLFSYDNPRQMHAWELILGYYKLKNGDKYNETPARKLSQSFNLEISGNNMISNKQSLLSAIGSIIAMHNPYKRSYNTHFKAFVCTGLNSHKLSSWLYLLFTTTELVNNLYASWSYVVRTGFRDALKSIDILTKYDFDLPVDLAIRQFQNIKDVFM